MDYFVKKEINKQKAVDHLTFVCKMYASEIVDAIASTEIYSEEDCTMLLARNMEAEEKNNIDVHFEQKGIVESVLDQRKSEKVAVLNFASYKHPGGMYLGGAKAQEECICHSSTLFPVIESFNDTFYEYNRENKNKALYKNRMLYSPNIIFMDEYGKKERLVDVITIAAPNRGVALKNGVSEEEIESVMRERIIITLEVAREHGIKTLFLGAFGCGVFKNNPEVTAKIFTEELKKYSGMKFIFPIPDSANYTKFTNAFTEAFVRGLL